LKIDFYLSAILIMCKKKIIIMGVRIIRFIYLI